MQARPILVSLPPLRQELEIHPGPDDANGVPSWTLHDPVDNRFFELSWPAFEILSRWSLERTAAVLEALAHETTLALTQTDIEGVCDFLQHYNLLQACSAQDSARLAQAASATRLSKPMWLLKHYLFFRVPLLRPMPFLQFMLPRIRWLFTRQCALVVLCIAVLGLYLVSQQWDSFVHTFAAYSGWQAFLGIGLALSLAKVAHELGHAFTAHRHGCRVPQMGVAFMVMLPMLYTDTNEAWKLSSRRARMQIGAAGMVTEIALAACATLLWSFLPDGPLRAGVFLLATSTWLITLAVNLSPFMRFDGYFLLSDWLGLANLHERAFALGRWSLREALFGWGMPPPEVFAPSRQRFLIVFAYATWLYRLFLFLGIALLVYHLFFKLLGVLLLIVELGWFIARPVQREVQVWWQERERMRWNRPIMRSVLLLALGVSVLCLPWPRGVVAPAVLGAREAQWIYAPVAGQLRMLAVKAGQVVAPGQILLNLDSAELRHQLGLALAREAQMRWQLQQQMFDERLQERGTTLQQRWQAAREELVGAQALVEQLQLRATFAARVVNFNPALQSGAWFARGERLLQLAGPQGVKVEAYVGEADLHRLEIGAPARFIADEPGLPGVACVLQGVDRIAVSALEYPALSSIYGGPIPASVDREGRVLPRDAYFRVRLQDCSGLAGTTHERTGSVVLGRAWRSLIWEWGLKLLAILQHERSL